MSNERKLEIAKQYVDKQLETMRRYGSAPKEMSSDQYNSLLQRVAKRVIS